MDFFVRRLPARLDAARVRLASFLGADPEALALDPDYLAARYNVVGLYIYQKQYTRARAELRKIMATFPGESRAAQILKSLEPQPGG